MAVQSIGQPSREVPTVNATGGPVLALSAAIWPAALVGLITATAYSLFSWRQWSSYTVLSWDLGIFTQLAKQYAAVQSPVVTIKGDGYNLLGDHFHPLLVLLGPIYAAFPSAFTLLIVQNLLFGVAAAVITHAAGRLLGRWAGLVFGLAFAFSWGLQGAVEAQFHEVAFAVPLLALSLSALLSQRWTACMLWAMPLVFVKEDLGLTVAVIGLVLAYRSRRTLGIWLAAWGVGWFGIASLIVLPLLNPDDRWAYTQSIDPATLLSDPASLFQSEKGITLALLVVASGAIALRSPLALVLLPTLAWRFTSDNSGYWGHSWQYSAVLMPVLFCAALDAIGACRSSPLRLLRGYGRVAPVLIVVAAVALLPQLPLAKLANTAGEFSTQRSEAANAALAVVPPGSLVESDVGLIGYLVDRNTVYWIGNANPTPDYLVVDLESGGLPEEWPSARAAAAQLHPGVSFHTVFSRGGYEVAKRIDD
ncbi:DUF2079 domain-containing protein [Cryobacterium roopkundense]|uniref:Putative membrane protein n=1 Tax=Cryobacterium roopkundense TaxID=1001240 RepID=A0A7W8ZZR8_9MICO|nr:DUF2079 domain-containing protein [Cryobacterium roopkundense]MBB5643244.1 putative membrane protein [Cryobacterium roopkundense]